ncbi:MAG: hypothetical protein ABSF60_11755 [Verrucomicrobiota bacterium]
MQYQATGYVMEQEPALATGPRPVKMAVLTDFLNRYDILNRQNSQARNISKSFVSNFIKPN